jgi:DNA polymerase elongation subunit (family B)
VYKNIFIDKASEGNTTVYIFDDKKGIVTLPWSQFNYAYVPDKNGSYVSMTGIRVSKKYRVSKLVPLTFEKDVPMETRVLTDLYLNEDTPSENVVTMFFDIEVSMENGIPNVHEPNNEVTSIALYDTKTKIYRVFVLDKHGYVSSDEHDFGNDVHITTFNNEVDLLKYFVDAFREIEPSIISGWNSDKFDVPYLYNRIRQQCGPAVANSLSPIGKVKYSEFRNRYNIAGVSSLDYLDLYKKFTYTQQPSYRLDAIGMTELGEGKIQYEGSLDDLLKNDINKYVQYNLQDVRILVKLDLKLRLVDLVRGICHVGHVPYEDYSMTSRVLEGTILTYLHRKKIIATNKPEGGRAIFEQQLEDDEDGFSGAYVKSPMPGLYQWIYSLDLQSLYPSIIMSLNISTETKIGKILNYDIKKHLNKELTLYKIQENDTIVELTYNEFIDFIEKRNLCVSSNGILYLKPKEHVVGEIIY